MIRRVALSALLFALALALPGGSALALDKVSIGVVGAVSDVTLYLAEKKGFLREEGIEGDLTKFDSGAKMVAPLGAGQLDVGAGAWSAGLFNAISRGINIKIVADKATNKAPYDYRLVLARKALVDQGQLKTFADFKGRKIGISAAGAADNSALNEALKKGHLKMADIERVYLGFGAQLVALSNGGIDLAFSAEPDGTIAEQKGFAVRFAPNSAFYPVQDTGILLFGSNFLDHNRALAERFMRAYLRAIRFYDDNLKDGKLAGPHADEIFTAIAELTKSSDPAVFRKITPFWGNPEGKIDMASLANDLAYFKASGDVTADVKPEQVVDQSFVTAALKQLGPYKPQMP